MVKSLLFAGLLALASTALAHGADESSDALARRASIARSFSGCTETLKTRSMQSKRLARRDAYADAYREARDIKPRATNESDPFNATVPLCVLANEEEIGPYYVPGELIRDDFREDEPGVDMLVDIQLFDVSTCEVIEGVMLDFWSANATGVYSGFSAEGTLGLTYLRGLQSSDEDGIVQITTKFPGHYAGRATHLHLIAHTNGTILDNGTYTGGSIPHIGQVFFPQDLISTIEATSPYDQNTVAITLNTEDRVFTDQAANTEGYSDIVNIEYLGDSFEDGVFAYISVGLNMSASYSTSSGAGGAGGPP